MMDLEKAALNKVYKTELIGDALVVELQGDAPGFSVGAVHNEMTTVIGLAKSPQVRNLIVDMSGSNYYGSLILGEIVHLGQTIREKGGRIALVGVSQDMKEVLRMMRLDAMWERYPHREMALRALTEIPWHWRLKPFYKPAALVAGVALLLAVFLLYPRQDYTKECYEQVVQLWNEGVRLRNVTANDTDWLLYTRKANKRLDEVTSKLKRIAGSHNEAANNLLRVAQDYLPLAIARQLDPKHTDTIAARYYLARTKAFLEGKEPPPLPKELAPPTEPAAKTETASPE